MANTSRSTASGAVLIIGSSHVRDDDPTQKVELPQARPDAGYRGAPAQHHDDLLAPLSPDEQRDVQRLFQRWAQTQTLLTQLFVAGHTPQLGMTSLHPSEVLPQLLPWAAQLRGVQVAMLGPHWLATPPPPQARLPLHVPLQSIDPPQPSGALPQLEPGGQVVNGVQQRLAVPPPPQVWPPAQLQVKVAEQPSDSEPHTPAGQARLGTQGPTPQTLAPPPPQMGVAGGQSSLQWAIPPQPSLIAPHAPAGQLDGIQSAPPSALSGRA
jgi:hypothetical protein